MMSALERRVRRLEAALPSPEEARRVIPVLTASGESPEEHLAQLIASGKAQPGDEVFVIRLVAVPVPPRAGQDAIASTIGSGSRSSCLTMSLVCVACSQWKIWRPMSFILEG